LGVTGSKIWLKIHLRGANKVSEVLLPRTMDFQTDFDGSGAQN